MAGLKSLAKETAIYGLSSIVGRFLNYLLVPVYTIALSAQSGGYGIVTNIYAWVALLLVLLTCGMETGFFRFANKGEDDPMRVYHNLAQCRYRCIYIPHVGIAVSGAGCHMAGIWRSPLVRGNDDDSRGYGCHSKYSFRLFAL